MQFDVWSHLGTKGLLLCDNHPLDIPTAVKNFSPLLYFDALPVVARELSRSARRQLDQLHLDQGGEQHQLHLQQDVDKLQLKQAGEHDQLHLDQGAHPDLDY